MDKILDILACDVGNSTIRLAHVSEGVAAEPKTLSVDNLDGLESILKKLWKEIPSPKQLIASSVNPSALKALEKAAKKALGSSVLLVGRDLPIPIETNLPNPDRIGTDRLCAAAAAFAQLTKACVVADFGSAVTIDCVNDQGVFMGGAILPGLELLAQSLNTGTAQLPKVKIAHPQWVFGDNTEQAIQAGIFASVKGAMRYLVESYATEIGHWPLVILTGGDAESVCENIGESELVQAIVPDLVLRGIAIAWYNHQTQTGEE